MPGFRPTAMFHLSKLPIASAETGFLSSLIAACSALLSSQLCCTVGMTSCFRTPPISRPPPAPTVVQATDTARPRTASCRELGRSPPGGDRRRTSSRPGHPAIAWPSGRIGTPRVHHAAALLVLLGPKPSGQSHLGLAVPPKSLYIL